ncbi:MAG: DNA primase [bacterium]
MVYEANNQVEEIKERLAVADIVGEYVQLKKAGTNFKALCPFHNEKTPSFMVSPEKNIWHCFGCGRGGDAITFVMEMEGLEFPEALKHLAPKAGVELKQFRAPNKSQKMKLLEISEWGSKFFIKSLQESRSGQVAREYTTERGLTEQTLQEFQIGYAPDGWEYLSEFLQKKGYASKEIVDAGLAIAKDNNKIFDRFRHRLMFPLHNVRGDLVGFTGRILRAEDGEKMGKYVNTPETLIYNKSQLVYNLHRAKKEIKQQDLAILVEGQMDVIASHQAGVKNVVATSGTALTEGQIDLLKRFTMNVAMAFDVDPAGASATERSIDLLLAKGFNVSVVNIPEGKDPDDLIRTNKEEWNKVIAARQSIMDYFFDYSFKGKNIQNVDDKKQVTKFLLNRIAKIEDVIERHHYVRDLARRINVQEEILLDALKKHEAKQYRPKAPIKKEAKTEENENFQKSPTGLLLGMLLTFPSEIDRVMEKITPVMLPIEVKSIYNVLKMYYSKEREKFDQQAFLNVLEKKSSELAYLAKVYLMNYEELHPDNHVGAKEITEEIDDLVSHIKVSHLKQKLKSIETAIKHEEKIGDQDKLKTLEREFDTVSKRLYNTIKTD